jgi:hypothetical protein
MMLLLAGQDKTLKDRHVVVAPLGEGLAKPKLQDQAGLVSSGGPYPDNGFCSWWIEVPAAPLERGLRSGCFRSLKQMYGNEPYAGTRGQAAYTYFQPV